MINMEKLDYSFHASAFEIVTLWLSIARDAIISSSKLKNFN